ncbi:HAAS signaling domain-containing protein [Pseudonocardia sp. HH130630-07]|uniref:HAAS signaling domain-containing protein n=1 Tax=Pseudonocardia sp. HH130630-07 TaxID=1690815 RepID=UPI000814DA7E|nr:hypothetical protein [Pseudonocardia sp. HH130630-07]ANY06535.1 hypothetical protein AFB00_09805 [Pseudonocardia sp. HH130630-07]
MTDDGVPAAELVERYLLRLRAATADLPADQREELLADLAAHLAEAVPPGSDELTARRVLDGLGAPELVAAAARKETGPVARPDAGPVEVYDVIAVLVLLLGGFAMPVLGWIVGVVLLWGSPRFSDQDKWLGTLAWPAVIAVGIVAFVAGGPLILMVGVLGLAALIWVCWHLLTAGRNAPGTPSVA